MKTKSRINKDEKNEADEKNHVVRNSPIEEHMNNDGENERDEENYVVGNNPNKEHINNDVKKS